MPLDRYAEYLPERPMAGYGLTQPDPQWPNGAKIAVSFVRIASVNKVFKGSHY